MRKKLLDALSLDDSTDLLVRDLIAKADNEHVEHAYILACNGYNRDLILNVLTA
jgi:hypothetical protein